MPDWSYHSLFRPVLFRLAPDQARDLTLGAVGRLARTRLGPLVIEAFGHMQPPASLAQELCGLHFPAPVGLGAGHDVHTVGVGALARFGLGFVEVGPVTLAPLVAKGVTRRQIAAQALWVPDLPVNDGLEPVKQRLAAIAPLQVPLGVRLAFRPGSSPTEATHERCALVQQLAPWANFFSLATRDGIGDGGWSAAAWHTHLQAVLMAADSCPVFVVLDPDCPWEMVQAIMTPTLDLGVAGVVVSGDIAGDGGRLRGLPAQAPARAFVRALRRAYGPGLVIIGAGGVHAPADALELLTAGASLVQVESGLVFAGPGLPKRINEAIIFQQAGPQGSPTPLPRTVRTLLRPGWWWTAGLGLGMTMGGVLAAGIALTRVVLPYDEAFVGLTAAQFAAINPQLLPFMAHDRLTLAGTMLSIGVLYSALALFGLRYGAHWAWKVLFASGAIGFASFFLFLGFGYFDPLHALVSALLLPCFLLGLLAPHAAPPHVPAPSLHNDRVWLRAQWGQAIFVLLGLGLIGGGTVIAIIGMQGVFVAQDLAFLHTTHTALAEAHPRLIPLVAHDRAGFGGALVADGVAVLLTALWGFRKGVRWLWWTLLLAGLAGFGPTLAIHLAVGYTDALHLFPVGFGLLLFTVALAWSYPYLCGVRRSA